MRRQWRPRRRLLPLLTSRTEPRLRPLLLQPAMMRTTMCYCCCLRFHCRHDDGCDGDCCRRCFHCCSRCCLDRRPCCCRCRCCRCCLLLPSSGSSASPLDATWHVGSRTRPDQTGRQAKTVRVGILQATAVAAAAAVATAGASVQADTHADRQQR